MNTNNGYVVWVKDDAILGFGWTAEKAWEDARRNDGGGLLAKRSGDVECIEVDAATAAKVKADGDGAVRDVIAFRGK